MSEQPVNHRAVVGAPAPRGLSSSMLRTVTSGCEPFHSTVDKRSLKSLLVSRPARAKLVSDKRRRVSHETSLVVTEVRRGEEQRSDWTFSAFNSNPRFGCAESINAEQ